MYFLRSLFRIIIKFYIENTNKIIFAKFFKSIFKTDKI